MKSILIKPLLLLSTALAGGNALAHPGEHGVEGLLATLAHLLGEHGYLPMLLLAAGLIAWRRARRT
jgi:hypothetical protein